MDHADVKEEKESARAEKEQAPHSSKCRGPLDQSPHFGLSSCLSPDSPSKPAAEVPDRLLCAKKRLQARAVRCPADSWLFG